jgi:antitoxin component YwqK of YwqJK toxin-antitoxin module
MKKCLILVALMFSGIIFSQEANPELVIVGQRVKAIYRFEDGKIQQEGFFEKGKLQGKWVSYDQKGQKVAVGEYNQGKKTGEWLFYKDSSITAVNYSESKITSVKSWKNQGLAKK